MQVKLENSHDVLTAYLSGDIDHHSAKSIREEIDSEIDKSTPSVLNLDFGEVSFMDSSGIGLVMGRYKKMQNINGIIRIVNTPLYISRVMRVSGVEKLAKISSKGENLNETNK